MSTSPAPYAVIVAGGNGSRAGAQVPKQFHELVGKPMLYYSIRAFFQAFSEVQIILVLPENHMDKAETVLQLFPSQTHIQVVAGGSTRFASVAAGLQSVPEDAIVMIHDGARPMLTPELISRCYETAIIYGNAIPVIEETESIREVSASGSHRLNRENLRKVQTPQAFQSAILKKAFQQAYIPSFTDEASVVESSGIKVHLIEGERGNIKITLPEDFIIAKALLEIRNLQLKA